MVRIDLVGDGSAWIEQGRLPDELLQMPISTLWRLHPAEFGKVKIMGKEIDTPRWQQCYDVPYYFSGMLHDAPPSPPELAPFKEWANGLGYGVFNQCLMNWYRDGNHYIGPHSDDETQLVNHSPIVSVSLGQQRTFRVRHRASKEIVHDIAMPSGTYLVMGGSMQRLFTHEVPKIAGKKGGALGARVELAHEPFGRVNITFRQFNRIVV